MTHLVDESTVKISSRGQMSLPADARRRWGIADGGALGVIDLGDCIVLVPSSPSRLRRELIDAISHETWKAAQAGFGDTDLANE